jgi:hypothetical protein
MPEKGYQIQESDVGLSVIIHTARRSSRPFRSALRSLISYDSDRDQQVCKVVANFDLSQGAFTCPHHVAIQ